MKTKLFLFALLAQFFSMTAWAYDAKIDGLYYNFTGAEAEVAYQRMGYASNFISDCSGDIVIPQSVTYKGKTYKVTSISYSAFKNCTGLSSITIPESVMSIGDAAFNNCTSLTSITIPESVIEIGSRAFDGTEWYNNQPDGMIYVGKIAYTYKGEMPENTTINIKNGTLGIADNAFENCSGLTSVIIPDGVVGVGSGAFYGCKNLNSIIIPESLKAIGSNAFDGTLWYDNQPDGVVYIGNFVYKYKGEMPENTKIEIKEGTIGIADRAFSYSDSLTSIVIPESVTSLGDGTFDGCWNLAHVNIPEGVTSIGNHLFYNCLRLSSITIPQGVTSIGSYAFHQCNLGSITIPEGVTCIGKCAFWGCRGLSSIIIPKSVTTIGAEITSYCYSLSSIVVAEGNTIYDSRNDCNAIIETTSNTLISGCKNTTIPESVTNIGDDAFGGCNNLTSINIPEGVTSIGRSAFYDCNSLTSISIPKSVTSIGDFAFFGYNRSNLTSIVVEEGNTVFDSRNDCNALIETGSNTLIIGCNTTIIPESVKSINKYAFSNCTDLTSIIIPEGVTNIDQEAFAGCSNLQSITIPESVIAIGINAFSGTLWDKNQPEGLVYAGKVAYKYNGIMPENTTINIKNGTLGIAGFAFSGCSGLTSIILPEDLITIGDAAFSGCSGLQSINIPNDVTYIGQDAFRNCHNLTSVAIPNGVKEINNNMFSDCEALTSIVIPAGVTSIGDAAFYNCNSLNSIIIPESINSIGDRAFCTFHQSVIKVGMKTPVTIYPESFSFSYSTTLYVPRGSKSAYEAADHWNECREIIECDYVDVEDQIIVAGQSETMEISVNTKPYTNLVGFQMDLTLPEGVSLDKAGCSLSSRITDEEQELTIGKLESGAYRLTSTSLSLKPISDTDGTLLTLKLTAAKDCVDGKATISNVIFSTDDSQRVTMDDESFDITIYYTYKLSYLIDGEEYLTDSVVYNTPLAPVAEPTKEGYTFYEWIGQPEIMPNHDVEVTAVFYKYGDVNTDDEVDVVDVVDIARFVVATPSNNFREKLADLNYDNTVNIADAVTLVNHIAGDQNFVKAAQPIGGSYDTTPCQLQLRSSGQKALSLCLNGDTDFTAFQLEVELPANTDISAMRINGLRKDGHQLLYNKVSENRYRVAALSLSNATFLGSEGELLNISIDGLATDDVCIHDIHFVKTNGTDVTFDNLYLSGNVTKIADVDGTESGSIYDLQGRHRSTLQRGLNIVGNKTIIKK